MNDDDGEERERAQSRAAYLRATALDSTSAARTRRYEPAVARSRFQQTRALALARARATAADGGIDDDEEEASAREQLRAQLGLGLGVAAVEARSFANNPRVAVPLNGAPLSLQGSLFAAAAAEEREAQQSTGLQSGLQTGLKTGLKAAPKTKTLNSARVAWSLAQLDAEDARATLGTRALEEAREEAKANAIGSASALFDDEEEDAETLATAHMPWAVRQALRPPGSASASSSSNSASGSASGSARASVRGSGGGAADLAATLARESDTVQRRMQVGELSGKAQSMSAEQRANPTAVPFATEGAWEAHISANKAIRDPKGVPTVDARFRQHTYELGEHTRTLPTISVEGGVGGVMAARSMPHGAVSEDFLTTAPALRAAAHTFDREAAASLSSEVSALKAAAALADATMRPVAVLSAAGRVELASGADADQRLDAENDVGPAQAASVRARAAQTTYWHDDDGRAVGSALSTATALRAAAAPVGFAPPSSTSSSLNKNRNENEDEESDEDDAASLRHRRNPLAGSWRAAAARAAEAAARATAAMDAVGPRGAGQGSAAAARSVDAAQHARHTMQQARAASVHGHFASDSDSDDDSDRDGDDANDANVDDAVNQGSHSRRAYTRASDRANDRANYAVDATDGSVHVGDGDDVYPAHKARSAAAQLLARTSQHATAEALQTLAALSAADATPRARLAAVLQSDNRAALESTQREPAILTAKSRAAQALAGHHAADQLDALERARAAAHDPANLLRQASMAGARAGVTTDELEEHAATEVPVLRAQADHAGKVRERAKAAADAAALLHGLRAFAVLGKQKGHSKLQAGENVEDEEYEDDEEDEEKLVTVSSGTRELPFAHPMRGQAAAREARARVVGSMLMKLQAAHALLEHNNGAHFAHAFSAPATSVARADLGGFESLPHLGGGFESLPHSGSGSAARNVDETGDAKAAASAEQEHADADAEGGIEETLWADRWAVHRAAAKTREAAYTDVTEAILRAAAHAAVSDAPRMHAATIHDAWTEGTRHELTPAQQGALAAAEAHEAAQFASLQSQHPRQTAEFESLEDREAQAARDVLDQQQHEQQQQQQQVDARIADEHGGPDAGDWRARLPLPPALVSKAARGDEAARFLEQLLVALQSSGFVGQVAGHASQSETNGEAGGEDDVADSDEDEGSEAEKKEEQEEQERLDLQLRPPTLPPMQAKPKRLPLPDARRRAHAKATDAFSTRLWQAPPSGGMYLAGSAPPRELAASAYEDNESEEGVADGSGTPAPVPAAPPAAAQLSQLSQLAQLAQDAEDKETEKQAKEEVGRYRGTRGRLGLVLGSGMSAARALGQARDHEVEFLEGGLTAAAGLGSMHARQEAAVRNQRLRDPMLGALAVGALDASNPDDAGADERNADEGNAGGKAIRTAPRNKEMKDDETDVALDRTRAQRRRVFADATVVSS